MIVIESRSNVKHKTTKNLPKFFSKLSTEMNNIKIKSNDNSYTKKSEKRDIINFKSSQNLLELRINDKHNSKIEALKRKSLSSNRLSLVLLNSSKLAESVEKKVTSLMSNKNLGRRTATNKQKPTGEDKINLGENIYKKNIRRSKKDLFIDLVATSIRSLNYKKLNYASSYSYKDNLIEELKKQPEFLQKTANKERRTGTLHGITFLDSIKNIIKHFNNDENELEKRDFNKISYCLKQIKGFNKFIKFNNINDDSILSAAKYLVFKEYKEGDYLYKEDDRTDGLYCLLSGDINEEKTKFILNFMINNMSLVTKTTVGGKKVTVNLNKKESVNNSPLKNNQDLDKLPKDIKNSYSDGDLFGHADLLHLKKRTTYAIVKSNTAQVIFLGLSPYNLCFSKELLRAEFERKEFISGNLTLCKNLDLLKLNLLFETIQPILLSQGETFFIEGSSNINLVVILYQGSAVLEKKIIKNDINSYKEALSEDGIFPTVKIMHLEPGNIAGLEVFSNEKIRKFTLKATSPFTSGLCINIDELSTEMKLKLKENLKPYIDNINKSHEKLFTDYLDIQRSSKLNYNTFTNLKDDVKNNDKKIQKIEQYLNTFSQTTTNRKKIQFINLNVFSKNDQHNKRNSEDNKSILLSKQLKNNNSKLFTPIKKVKNSSINAIDTEILNITQSEGIIQGTNIVYNFTSNFHQNTFDKISLSVKKQKMKVKSSILDTNDPIILQRTQSCKKKIRKQYKYSTEMLKMTPINNKFSKDDSITTSKLRKTTIDNQKSIVKHSSFKTEQAKIYLDSNKSNKENNNKEVIIETLDSCRLNLTSRLKSFKISNEKISKNQKLEDMINNRDLIIIHDNEVVNSKGIENKTSMIKKESSLDTNFFSKSSLKKLTAPNKKNLKIKIDNNPVTEFSVTSKYEANKKNNVNYIKNNFDLLNMKEHEKEIILKEDIVKNIQAWKKRKNNKNIYFQSGSFKLPLLTELIKEK